MGTTNHPSPETHALAAVGLSVIAGYTDGYALRHFHTYVSFISGNTTTAATRIGSGAGALAIPSLTAVAGFFAGSFAGNWIASSSLEKPRRAILLISAGLLLIHIAFLAGATGLTDILLLSLAMALLNPSVNRIGAEPVNVTFVTGTVSKATGHLALAIRGKRPDGATGPGDTHMRRAGFEALLWAALFSGAVSSVAADRLGTLAAAPACVALFALAAVIRQ